MNDRDLQNQLDAYLNRFATFAAPPLAVRIPGRRGGRLNVLTAVAVVAVVVAVLAAPIVLTRFQSQHRAPAIRPQPTANVSRPPLHHNGQIVTGFGNGLIAIDPATGNQNVIFSVPAGDVIATPGDVVASPAYSPDGTKIAYLLGSSDRSGAVSIFSIWILDTTTGHTRQLTTCNGCSATDNVSWSPDGSRLAFSEADQGGSLQLHLIGADGMHRTQLTYLPAPENAGQPTWSPDGTRIAFTVFTIGHVPNQREVVTALHLDVIRADGTGLAVLLATGGQGNGYDDHALFPEWSPNGSRIAYALDPPQPGSGENQYQVWLMNPDGSHRTEIFRRNGCCGPVGGLSYTGPAWSPDGTRIAAEVGFALWVMNADGSAPRSQSVIDLGDRLTWQPVP
jgi:Tol biopolymer transport system component